MAHEAGKLEALAVYRDAYHVYRMFGVYCRASRRGKGANIDLTRFVIIVTTHLTGLHSMILNYLIIVVIFASANTW